MKGRMVRIGTALDAKESTRSIPAICKDRPAIVVLGNEEHGISDEVRKNVDHLVLIPFISENGEPQVDSLNVAQAASIIMYELSANGK